MADDRKRSLDEAVRAFMGARPDDHDAVKAFVAELAGLVAADADLLARLYERYFTALRALVDGAETGDALLPDEPSRYRFVLAFSSGVWLGRRRAQAQQLLFARHAEHLALIDRALERPDRRLCDEPWGRRPGRFGDVAAAAIDLYRRHGPHGADDAPQAAEAAQRVPRLFRAFPEQDSLFALSLLKERPDATEHLGDLVRFFILQRRSAEEGPMGWIALDMLGFLARRDDPVHAKAAAILTRALHDARDWPPDLVRLLVEDVVLRPLDMKPRLREDEIARKKKSVESARRWIETTTFEGRFGTSAETIKRNHLEQLAKDERELEFMRADFEGWSARRRAKAVRRIAVSQATRRALEVVATKLPDAAAAPVAALLGEARLDRERPRRFPMPKPADKRFKDFGLKLLVIEALMYRHDALEPRFDVRAFAWEYDKREISVEDDGYAIIPEVARYFRDLPISDDLLARVETLHQSSGLDGGPGFMAQLHPFWDPGCGDEPVAVTARAAGDLDLLPNLKRISGLENSRPGPKLLKALRERGIDLADEEDGP